MTCYRIFDTTIACKFLLPGLQELTETRPDWRVELTGVAIPENELDWFHHWKTSNDEEIMACARHGDTYVMSFNNLAWFSIDFALQEITVLLLEDCPDVTLAHLLLDQVFPRVLGHQGRVVVHASAVKLSNGRAVAFTGKSGQGKSTLASAFFSAGMGLIGDDCLLLEKRDGAVYALAAYPSLRLWGDSADAVIEKVQISGAGFAKMAHYSDKKQLLFEKKTDPGPPQWVKLDRLYLLEEDFVQLNPGLVDIVPLAGMASIMALIESFFALDLVTETSIRRNFRVVQELVSGIVARRLSYARDYDLLPTVIAAVIADTNEPA